MPESQPFWNQLFACDPAQGRGIPVQMRLLRKHGEPFLLLPEPPRAAAASLALYPAQTRPARAAKILLRWLLRSGLSVKTKKVSFTLPLEAPLVKFLLSAAGSSSSIEAPTFGVLAGNPATAGQRFLVLLFDANQKPFAVVKAGLSERARALIDKEQAFLSSVPANTPGIPKLRAAFQSPQVCALALEFFQGDSPRRRDEGVLPSLFISWVDTDRKLPLAQTPDWRRLEQAGAQHPCFPAISYPLRSREVHPAIHHGDFAPWNIKVSPQGDWTVLDWERGELAGIPGWDWFHYVLQPGLLVERLPVSGLIHKTERLLQSEAFKLYAERAGISGLERELVLAYLLHCAEVIKPSEGLAPTRELLDALCARWLHG